MAKRTITGAVFVAVIVGFLLLYNYVDERLFQILIWFFSFCSAYELARALKPYMPEKWNYVAIIFGALFIPHYAFINYYFSKNNGWLFSLLLPVLFAIGLVIYSLIIKAEKKKILVGLIPLVYPALLLLTWSLCVDFGSKTGLVALILIFVISSLSDTFAYLVGMIYNKIRKGNAKKLCPKLSPKKTVAGAIGGIVGGIIGAMLVLFIFNGTEILPLYAYIILGVVCSVLTEGGDLVESYIKRKVGIKDMGNIMPGHGGIMDRIDGMSFSGAFIYLIFTLLI